MREPLLTDRLLLRDALAILKEHAANAPDVADAVKAQYLVNPADGNFPAERLKTSVSHRTPF